MLPIRSDVSRDWISFAAKLLLILGTGIGYSPMIVSAQDDVATEPTAPPKAADAELNLDALLDLAEQDPSRLQSIAVKPGASGLSLTPDNVFRPDSTSAGSGNSTGSLLSQAPGVVLRMTSALNQDVRIRGFTGSQVVGVANGMNQVKTRPDVDSLFSQIDPTLVESVAVISGPYAVEYGPGFSFFDAKLITPRRTAELSWKSHSTFGFNTNGQQLMWRDTAEVSDATSGAFVSFGQRIGNDYQPGGQSNDYRVPASYNVRDVYVAVSQDVTSRSRIDASYLRQVLQNTELPGVAYDINDQHADQLNLNWTWHDDAVDMDRFQMQFWWNQAAYQGDASRQSKQITFFDRLVGEPYPDTAGGGTLVGDGFTDNWGARVLSHWGDPDWWKITVGADWRRVRQRYAEVDYQPDGSVALLGDTFGIPQSTMDDAGLFVSSVTSVNDRWQIQSGQRFDTIAYGLNTNDTVLTSTQLTPNGDFVPGFNTSQRFASTTYLMNSYRASDTLTLNAGAAYAMRPPNLTERYSDQPFAPLVRFGNSFAFGDSNLASERNLQFDMGFTSRHERTTFGARAFHSTIRDYIGLAVTNYTTIAETGTAPPGDLGRLHYYMVDPNANNPDLSSDSASIGYIYRNIDRVTLYGFDLLAEQQVQPWLELVGVVTFTEGINHDPTWVDVYNGTTNTVSQREGLPGIYPINLSATVRFVEPEHRKWTLEWQSRFVHNQGYLATSLGEVGTPGFAVHNIHASYRWTDHISLRSSLLNVLDRNYYEHNSLAIVDRNGNIGFVKNPGISWFVGCEVDF